MRRFDKVHTQGSAVAAQAGAGSGTAMAGTGFVDELRCAADECVLHAGRGGVGGSAGHAGRGRDAPGFGWRARVPLRNGRFDRTEVDMRLGGLLVEAKLTESDFQTCKAAVAESYRDFERGV